MTFKYKGFTASGSEVAGTFDAVSMEEAAGKLRQEHGLFLSKIEPSSPQPQAIPPVQPPAPPPTQPSSPASAPKLVQAESPIPAPTPAPAKRSLSEDMDRAMEVIKMFEDAKLPKTVIAKAKEEMVLCLVRKAILK